MDYDAFISYRRSDGSDVARWLRRELLAYRVPVSMRDRFGRRLRIYMDTAYERGTSDFYEQNVKPVLLSSSYLIVVATPGAVQRANGVNDWIAREITDFAVGPNGRNIIAVRGAGDFAGPLPGNLAIRFPNIEIVDLRGAGPLWYFSPTRVSRLTSEKLKIVAPLLNVPFEDMPKLRQEEENRQQSRRGALVGATLGVLVAVSGLSIFALHSRNQAIRSLEDSMFATGSMVLRATDLNDDAADPAARTRRLLINQGCDLIDNLSSSSGVEPGITEFVTCKLYRAQDREEAQEQTEAKAMYEEAIRKAAARYAGLPRPDAADALIQAQQSYAEYFVRQNDDDSAETQYRKLLKAAQNYSGSDPTRPEYPAAEANALASLGHLYSGRHDALNAGISYDQAAAAVSRQITLEDDKPKANVLEFLASLYRMAGEQRQSVNDPDGAIDRFNKALSTLRLIGADQLTPDLYQEDAVTNADILTVERALGDSAAVEKAVGAALSDIAQVIASQVASADLKQKAQELKTRIATQQGSH